MHANVLPEAGITLRVLNDWKCESMHGVTVLIPSATPRCLNSTFQLPTLRCQDV